MDQFKVGAMEVSKTFATHNLTQIFFALLPNKNNNQNKGKKEKLQEIQDLLKFNVDVNAEIHPGYTALCRVIEHGGSKSLVELLLHYGARIDITSEDFSWKDTDGKIISNQVFALARQRALQYQDKESLDIQHLIQKQLIQKHLMTERMMLESESPEFPSQWPSNVFAAPVFLNEGLRKKVFIFEFDVLVNANFHNILNEMGVMPGRASPDLIDFLIQKYGIRHKNLTLEIFKEILQQGNGIHITSISRYPEAIWGTLMSLGLSESELEKIYYDPEKDEFPVDLTKGKNPAILKAMVHFDIIDINAVYLIDQDPINLQIAKAKLNVPAAHLIKVEKESQAISHLQQIQASLKKSMGEELKFPTRSPSAASGTLGNTEIKKTAESAFKTEFVKTESVFVEAPEVRKNDPPSKTSDKLSAVAYMPYINFDSIHIQVQNTGNTEAALLNLSPHKKQESGS